MAKPKNVSKYRNRDYAKRGTATFRDLYDVPTYSNEEMAVINQALKDERHAKRKQEMKEFSFNLAKDEWEKPGSIENGKKDFNKFSNLSAEEILLAKKAAQSDSIANKTGLRKVADFFTSGTQDYIGNLLKTQKSMDASKTLSTGKLGKEVDAEIAKGKEMNDKARAAKSSGNTAEADRLFAEAAAYFDKIKDNGVDDSNNYKVLQEQQKDIPTVKEGVSSAVMATTEIAPWLSGFNKAKVGMKGLQAIANSTDDVGKLAAEYYLAKQAATQTGKEAFKKALPGMAAETATYGAATTAADVLRQEDSKGVKEALLRSPINFLTEGLGELGGYGLGRLANNVTKNANLSTAKGAYKDDLISQLVDRKVIGDNTAGRLMESKVDVDVLEEALAKSGGLELPKGEVGPAPKPLDTIFPATPRTDISPDTSPTIVDGITEMPPKPGNGLVDSITPPPETPNPLTTGPQPLEARKTIASALGMLDPLDDPNYVSKAESLEKILEGTDDVSRSIRIEDQNLDEIMKADAKYKQVTGLGKVMADDKTVFGKAGKLFETMETRLAGQGPVGQKLLKGFRNMSYRGTQLKQAFNDMAIIARDNPEIVKEAIDQIESGAPLGATATKLKTGLDGIFTLAKKSGLDVDYRQRYFPHVFDPKQENAFMQWAAEMWNTKSADPEFQKTPLFEAIKKMQDTATPKKAMAEFGRVEGIPESFYIQDKAVALSYYIDQMSDRIAEAEVWGKDMSTFNKLTSYTKQMYGNQASKDVQELMSLTRYGTAHQNEALQQLRAFQVLTKMGTSVFSNSTQSGNTITMGGINNFKSAVSIMNKARKGDAAALKEIADIHSMAALNTQIISDELAANVHRLGNGKGLPNWADNMLSWTQFKRVEDFNRISAALTGKQAVEQNLEKMLRNGEAILNGKYTKEARFLQQCGVDVDSVVRNGGMSPQELGQAVHEFVGRTQFYVSPKDLPLFVNRSQASKTIFQLSQFAMKHGEFLKEQIGKELAHGNVAPLFRYLGVMLPAGTGVLYIKNKAIPEIWNHTAAALGAQMGVDLTIEPKGRETELGDIKDLPSAGKFALESLEKTGGFGYLPGLIGNSKFSDTPAEFILNSMGPTGSDIGAISDTVIKYNEQGFSAGTEKLFKEALKRIPIVGSYVKQGMYPYDPKASSVYDMAERMKLGTISSSDINDFTKSMRNGEDLSESVIGRRLTSKLYDENGKEKEGVSQETKDEILSLLQQYGVSPDKARDRTASIQKARKEARSGLSDEDKLLLDSSKDEMEMILAENEETLDDHPKLKDFIDKFGQ